MLNGYRVIKFGTPIFKVVKGSTRTKKNQSAKSNLSVDKLQSEVAKVRKQGSAWPSRYYHLINRKRIDEAIFSEIENMITIITDHIKYLEVYQLRYMKAASYRSPTWSKPANTNF